MPEKQWYQSGTFWTSLGGAVTSLGGLVVGIVQHNPAAAWAGALGVWHFWSQWRIRKGADVPIAQ